MALLTIQASILTLSFTDLTAEVQHLAALARRESRALGKEGLLACDLELTS